MCVPDLWSMYPKQPELCVLLVCAIQVGCILSVTSPHFTLLSTSLYPNFYICFNFILHNWAICIPAYKNQNSYQFVYSSRFQLNFSFTHLQIIYTDYICTLKMKGRIKKKEIKQRLSCSLGWKASFIFITSILRL